MESLKLVGISFHTAGKIFDFDAREFELQAGDQVIVETERGRALGNVVRAPREINADDAPPKLKAVLRKAGDSDLSMADGNAQREAEALIYCQQRVAERQLEMKLVRSEYLYDGSKIIFYFTADGRIDFRELVRDLAQHFRTRIEMRQIGVRDEAKLVGGIGVCGRELCCCTFLRNFAPVSVKMAKTQGLALNPTKISGQCGRLLCCLGYEYETYSELRKNLPKCGKKIQLSSGPAEVVAIDVLAQKMTVCCENGERCELNVDDLKKRLEDQAKEKPESAGAAPQTQPEGKAERGKDERTGKADRRSNRRPNSRNRRSADAAPERQQTTSSSDGQKEQNSESEGQKAESNRPRRRNRRRPRRRSNKPKTPENK